MQIAIRLNSFLFLVFETVKEIDINVASSETTGTFCFNGEQLNVIILLDVNFGTIKADEAE